MTVAQPSGESASLEQQESIAQVHLPVAIRVEADCRSYALKELGGGDVAGHKAHNERARMPRGRQAEE